jgi:hypothetical protein
VNQMAGPIGTKEPSTTSPSAIVQNITQYLPQPTATNRVLGTRSTVTNATTQIPIVTTFHRICVVLSHPSLTGHNGTSEEMRGGSRPAGQPSLERPADARRRARPFPGEPADDLDASAGLAEGALDEVAVADAAPVLGREPQVHGKGRDVAGDARDRRGVAGLPLRRELGGLAVRHRDGLVAGLGVADGEDGPEVGLYFVVVVGRHLGQDVAAAVDETALAQAVRVGPVERAGQAGCAVADSQQRCPQAARLEVGEEVVPGVGRLRGRRGQAHEHGLAVGVDAPRASTGSAEEPGCIRKWLPSRNR